MAPARDVGRCATASRRSRSPTATPVSFQVRVVPPGPLPVSRASSQQRRRAAIAATPACGTPASPVATPSVTVRLPGLRYPEGRIETYALPCSVPDRIATVGRSEPHFLAGIQHEDVKQSRPLFRRPGRQAQILPDGCVVEAYFGVERDGSGARLLQNRD